ncbi:MAG: 30S ribosomal protein S16 [Actinomycetota bacterium]
MVRIRLRRMGAKKRPFYRVVVTDQRNPRDGRFIEIIGKYHPMDDPSLIEIDEEKALGWLDQGAQPSAAVQKLLVHAGIWDKFPGAGTSPTAKRAASKAAKSKKMAKASA